MLFSSGEQVTKNLTLELLSHFHLARKRKIVFGFTTIFGLIAFFKYQTLIYTRI